MMVLVAAVLIAPMASSLTQLVASSLINGLTGKRPEHMLTRKIWNVTNLLSLIDYKKSIKLIYR